MKRLLSSFVLQTIVAQTLFRVRNNRELFITPCEHFPKLTRSHALNSFSGQDRQVLVVYRVVYQGMFAPQTLTKLSVRISRSNQIGYVKVETEFEFTCSCFSLRGPCPHHLWMMHRPRRQFFQSKRGQRLISYLSLTRREQAR